MRDESPDMYSATLVIEKRVIQEAAKTMPFLPRCCDRASEELALMTCHLLLDFRYPVSQWYFIAGRKGANSKRIPGYTLL